MEGEIESPLSPEERTSPVAFIECVITKLKELEVATRESISRELFIDRRELIRDTIKSLLTTWNGVSREVKKMATNLVRIEPQELILEFLKYLLNKFSEINSTQELRKFSSSTEILSHEHDDCHNIFSMLRVLEKQKELDLAGYTYHNINIY